MKYSYLILWFFSVLFSSVSHADALADLNVQLKSFSHLTAQFTQTVTNAKGEKQYQISGFLQVKKPNQLYWETKMPMPQIIVADGKKLWVYDKDLNQVTVKAIRQELLSTPALLLSGDARQVSEKYQVNAISAEKEMTAFELIPMEDKASSQKSPFQKLTLTFQKNQLAKMELWDTLGQATKIDFSNVKMNSDLDERKFHFVPPKSVDVVKDFN